MDILSREKLFFELFNAQIEKAVDQIITQNGYLSNPDNWHPLDGNKSNFGIIENQQSSPIAALIEKITNSIDAILMRQCIEADINPKSDKSPKNMDEAIKSFYNKNSSNYYKNWDLSSNRKKQSEEIQIIADGPRGETSLIVYDNGEGQHPEKFKDTFLSLLKGNKSEIPFVQGKYNMGGTGAIVFCGKKSYQLIGSRRFNKSGNFGFTLIREHPFTEEEKKKVDTGYLKNTWYEYFAINDAILSFPIKSLNLNLKGREFESGAIIKLYSYELPSGSRSVISRDLNQSINEYLFRPALPIFTIDKFERYPKDKNLERDLFGLKRRLEQSESRYVDDSFSEEFTDTLIGNAKITCYIFKNKIKDKSIGDSRKTVRREFFKNNMSVLFSLNGQVHGHYTSEFITRALKMSLLKNHLLIHVDCSKMNYEFRKELFMASRDRLKGSKETSVLRKELANTLNKGKLKEIYKKRKDQVTTDVSDSNELLKSFTKSIPFNKDLLKLLQNSFKIDIPKPVKNKSKNKKKEKKGTETFNPERFPSVFKLKGVGSSIQDAVKIPEGSSKTIHFLTDVENQYFDRSEEPGELSISLLDFKPNDTEGGNAPGQPKKLTELINIRKASPNEGKIKIAFNPTEELTVGDYVQIKVDLSGPKDELEERFWVRVVEKKKKPEEIKKKEEDSDLWGLPNYRLVYKFKEGELTWEKFGQEFGDEIDYSTTMIPFIEGDVLDTIFINMDSTVIKNYKSKIKSITEEQIELANKKYVSSVFFHTLFLYSITKKKNYDIKQQEVDVDLSEFLKEIFSSHYTDFLMNFGTEALMASLSI